ncbi:hypothetical protein A9Z42_0049730 [Trichoderma parareesei]|uniref:Uncharacterized protein n=1 Tax=Trichoderma parareesei TaxID=858221 RepID=A0A2H2Z947_TRIPA|nr:hypothetical protein A9Z42_0049730 [Trichoderma parareesei]
MPRMPRLPIPGPGQKRILDFSAKSIEPAYLRDLSRNQKKMLRYTCIRVQQQPMAATFNANDGDDEDDGQYELMASRFLIPPFNKKLKRKKEKKTSTQIYAGQSV